MENHEECLRCGRKLKNSRYKQIGYGKTCYKKSQEEQLKEEHIRDANGEVDIKRPNT